MWIIQEVVMGKTVNVVCGSYTALWDGVIYLAGKFMEKYLLVVLVKTLRSTRRNELVSELQEKVDTLSLSAHRIAEIGRARVVRKGLPQIRDINVG
jgi:hypothetical protein